MSEGDKHSKTEQPTQRKLSEAKQKSSPPLSRDMSATVSLLVSMVVLYSLGGRMFSGLKENCRDIFAGMGTATITETSAYSLLLRQFLFFGELLAPFLLMVMVAGIAGVIVQGGVSFSTERLQLKFENLNPVTGFQRFFKREAAVEGIKSIIKISIVGFIAYRVLRDEMDGMLYLSDTDIRGIFNFISHMAFKIVIHACGVMIIMAVLDLAFVKWNYLQNLKMTKEEVKKEAKDTEGDPHLKGKIKKLRYERAYRRLRQIIPTADVVVTNPTHFAVALKYDRNRMAAPIVLAKGVDHLAQRIKTMARENNVMLVENRFLARELHANVKEGEEIPESLYVAVAEVLAYVYGIKGKMQ